MSKNDTNICKFIAITLMYVHHVFFSTEYFSANEIIFGKLVPDSSTLIFIAQTCKICVAIFVFLSGYGTARSHALKNFSSDKQMYSYTIKRYIKLLLSFQIVFIIAQIFSFLGLSRTVVYGKGTVSRYFNMFLDFMGVSYITQAPTFNASWWYMSFALTLILILPLLIKLSTKYNAAILLIAFLLLRFLNVNGILLQYAFPALAGILFAQNDYFERIKNFKDTHSQLIHLIIDIILLIVFILLIKLRQRAGICMDVIETAMTIIVCYFVTDLLDKIPVLSKILAFIGSHSMNMYFVHSFITYYYFRNFTYSFKYPLLIILVLIGDTLLFSVIIELLKKLFKFSKITNYISNHVAKFCNLSDQSAKQEVVNS